MKIFLIVFLFFFNFFVTFALESPKIISREEWWANLDFMDRNSTEWKNINEKKLQKAKTQTEKQKKSKENTANLTKQKNEFLLKYFPEENKISEKKYFYEWKSLAWPIEYSSKIRAIIVHHTHSDFEDSYEWIRNIYKYHALSNQRWDIWYNFLIWKNWEIFEWRAGGEMAVWAHAVWNNRQTIWISVIWNYDTEPISEAQYNSLENLIKYLVEKYEINLNEKQPFFRNCLKNCSDVLEVNYHYPLLWHRDAGHTTCPWDAFYRQLLEIRKKLQNKKDYNYDPKREEYFKIFDKISEQTLLEIFNRIEDILAKNYDSKYEEIKKYLIKYFEEKYKK